MIDSLVFVGQTIRFGARLRLDRRGLPALQLRRFRRLLAYAQKHSPYLREKYRGLDPSRCQPSDVPPLTKSEMMLHFDDLVTDRRVNRRDLEVFVEDSRNVGALFRGQYPVLHTSGSQGQPAFLVGDRWHFVRLAALHAARAHALPKTGLCLAANLLRRQKLAAFQLRPGFYPSGVASAHMLRTLRSVTRILPLYCTDPFDENLRKLNEFQPNFISGYGHVLVNLAQAELDGRLRLRSGGQLRLVTSFAEPISDETRERVQAAFGVNLANEYSMGECLSLTVGCPHYAGAHLNSDVAMLEVIDRQRRPVPDGKPGDKVLVSDLLNYVQPILRYENDDVVTMSDRPCPCGSPFPLVRSIAGRFNDRHWISFQGEPRELPTFFFNVAFHPLFDLAEFQVNQVERNRFDILAVPIHGSGLTVERILHALDERARDEGLKGVLQFTVKLVSEIPPDPRTGKLRRNVTHVPPPSLETVRPVNENAS